MLGKAFSERSEDFSAAQRWESIGIFRLSEKSLDFFDSLRSSCLRNSYFYDCYVSSSAAHTGTRSLSQV